MYQPWWLLPSEGSVYQPWWLQPSEASMYQPWWLLPSEGSVYQPWWLQPSHGKYVSALMAEVQWWLVCVSLCGYSPVRACICVVYPSTCGKPVVSSVVGGAWCKCK